MSRNVIVLVLYDCEGNKSGKRRFAVADKKPVVVVSWSSNRDIPCQGDQRWELRVWRRIEDRGFVAYVEGSGQWGNRGDHGSYVGTDDTAESALLSANPGYGEWGEYPAQDWPEALASACRAFDTEDNPPPVE